MKSVRVYREIIKFLDNQRLIGIGAQSEVNG